MQEGRILSIWIYPGQGAAHQEMQEAIAVEEGGLQGDRRRSQRRAVTLLDEAAWEAAINEAGTSLGPASRRANILVRGMDLSRCVGRRLRVGTALLEVCGETEPCHKMDEKAPGLRAALDKDMRGGVCCYVQEGGVLRPDDAVTVQD
jgi:MOSC domain-containing protein YiiM